MKIKDPNEYPNAFETIGAWGDRYTKDTAATYGVAIYGAATYGNLQYNEISDTFGIYQRRKIYGKKYNVKYDFYDYVISHSAAITAYREKFASAVAGWQSLTSEQKEVYNQRAKYLDMFGFNLYIREYMLS